MLGNCLAARAFSCRRLAFASDSLWPKAGPAAMCAFVGNGGLSLRSVDRRLMEDLLRVPADVARLCSRQNRHWVRRRGYHPAVVVLAFLLVTRPAEVADDLVR